MIPVSSSRRLEILKSQMQRQKIRASKRRLDNY